MSLKKRDKDLLTTFLSTIIVEVARLLPEEESIEIIENTKSVSEFLLSIADKLKEKEATGWDGSDMTETQLNVFELASEVYARRNKSKYKCIEKPSEIIIWIVKWLEEVFVKSELSWKNYNRIKCKQANIQV